MKLKLGRLVSDDKGAHLLDIACIVIERRANAIFSLLKVGRIVRVSIATEIFARSVCAPFGPSFATVLILNQ